MSRGTIRCAMLVGALLSHAACAAQSPDSLLVSNVTIVDVRSGTTRGPLDILITGERISAVAPSGSLPSPAAQRIDGSGMFVISRMREPIDELRARRIPVDPTLIAYHTDYWGDQPIYRESRWNGVIPELREDWNVVSFTDDFTPADFARGRRLWPKTLTIIRRYFDAGILLTTGSDLPNPWVVPGISLHQEMSLLASAGIPPADVLRMATLNGAISLGLESEIGAIERGFIADLVLLERNPLEDIANTRTIHTVIARGRVVRAPR